MSTFSWRIVNIYQNYEYRLASGIRHIKIMTELFGWVAAQTERNAADLERHSYVKVSALTGTRRILRR